MKTQSPLFYVHAELQPGGRIGLPSEYPERAAYVVAGRVKRTAERWPGADAGLCWQIWIQS